MKSLKVGDMVWVDCHKAKIIKITGDGVVGLVLDDGLWVEFYYECSLHDISLDDNGDFVLDTEFFPVVGDVITINEKEFQLADIDEGVVTLKRGDEIRCYSFYDIEHDIMNGYWISSVCEQVRSPSVKLRLEVYFSFFFVLNTFYLHLFYLVCNRTLFNKFQINGFLSCCISVFF